MKIKRSWTHVLQDTQSVISCISFSLIAGDQLFNNLVHRHIQLLDAFYKYTFSKKKNDVSRWGAIAKNGQEFTIFITKLHLSRIIIFRHSSHQKTSKLKITIPTPQTIIKQPIFILKALENCFLKEIFTESFRQWYISSNIRSKRRILYLAFFDWLESW